MEVTCSKNFAFTNILSNPWTKTKCDF